MYVVDKEFARKLWDSDIEVYGLYDRAEALIESEEDWDRFGQFGTEKKYTEADIRYCVACAVKVSAKSDNRCLGCIADDEAELEGTEGQDRESYSDDQDRESYSVLDRDPPIIGGDTF